MPEQAQTKTIPAPAPAKSFMTAGPTLHYSHTNVLWFWGLTILAFVLVCFFWKLLMPLGRELEVTGLRDFSGLYQLLFFRLGTIVMSPISIFEYPLYIVVLGILMGCLAVLPVLVSQLLSFRFCIPLVLSIMFVAELYFFGVLVLVSCIAVACRPLRFRSRFMALTLCMTPQLIYWAIWGGYPTADPVRWGFSFSPWIYAWLSGLFMATIILGVGHYTRYKPGLVWLTCFVFLGVAYGIFQHHIGFAELDYHRYVAGNDPEGAVEFHDQSLSETIDKVIEDNFLRSRLEGRFYPTESVELRQKLKEEIQDFLGFNDRWPEWFRRKMPETLKYQLKRQSLIIEYDKFIERWPGNQERMPIVLYYKAILNECHPDVRLVADRGLLRFYDDYPFEDNALKWQELYNHFSDSPEAIEARWRIAIDRARRGDFDKAEQICEVAQVQIDKELKKLRESQSARSDKSDSIFAVFQKPPESVMTVFKLNDLNLRFRKLQSCISEENRGTDPASKERLSEFLKLNPYDLNYTVRLDGLLDQMPRGDGLRENILLEKIKRVDDLERRSQMLSELAEEYPGRDSAVEARYELGLVTIQLWKKSELPLSEKMPLLIKAQQILTDISNQPHDCPYAQQAAAALQTLPQIKLEAPVPQ